MYFLCAPWEKKKKKKDMVKVQYHNICFLFLKIQRYLRAFVFPSVNFYFCNTKL